MRCAPILGLVDAPAKAVWRELIAIVVAVLAVAIGVAWWNSHRHGRHRPSRCAAPMRATKRCATERSCASAIAWT